MEGGFSYGDIMSLSNLITGGEKEDTENHFYSNETQSTLNPGILLEAIKKRDSKT